MGRFCPNCGAELNNGVCSYCSSSNNQLNNVNQGMQQPMMNQGMQQPMMNQGMQQSSLPKDNMGLIALICGIVGFLCCTYASIAGLICGAISLSNINKGKVDGKKWMPIVGLVFSVLGVIVMIINIVNMINGANEVYNIISNMYE